jgi:hypothetical protein
MLLDPTQCVGEYSGLDYGGDKLGRIRFDLGSWLTVEGRSDESRLDLSVVAKAQGE